MFAPEAIVLFCCAPDNARSAEILEVFVVALEDCLHSARGAGGALKEVCLVGQEDLLEEARLCKFSGKVHRALFSVELRWEERELQPEEGRKRGVGYLQEAADRAGDHYVEAGYSMSITAVG